MSRAEIRSLDVICSGKCMVEDVDRQILMW